MKGHDPFEVKCKLEVNEQLSFNFLELGSTCDYCDCEQGNCKKDENKE